jgi:radical SAM protein with 4Fe4S-binding SPASM domain
MKKTGLSAGGLKLRKTKLKPYVHKVKGARNHALYDLLKGNFYSLTPGGNVEELKECLKAAGLTFETDGVVPFKTEFDLTWEKNFVNIREMQIRLNGRGEDNCQDRNKISTVKKFLEDKTLHLIKTEVMNIPIKRIYLAAEIEEKEKIEFLMNEFPYDEMEINVEEGIGKTGMEHYKKICNQRSKKIVFSSGHKKNLTELKVGVYEFFYYQHYNPCLGHQIAVDCLGEIKPCLWYNGVIGKIGKDKLFDLIISGKFDNYWEQTKDKIDICKECELRYACPDCRVRGRSKNGRNLTTGKPDYCNYDPYSGDLSKAPR